jgi:predicted aspartyl protease
MRLSLSGDLPFVTITLTHRGVSAEIADVLIDTGSASTVISSDAVAALGIIPEPSDRLRTLRGVGGRELVFTGRLDRLEVEGRTVDDFDVEIGGMDYGFGINGILGMDFLTRIQAIINLRDFVLE